MASPAESSIEKIFEAADEDERTRPVIARLHEAYGCGEWKPDALAGVVEQATLAEIKERK